MKTILQVCTLAAAVSVSGLVAQTNPTAFNMNASGNYLFDNWPSSSPTGTYPSNMIFHLLNTTNPPVTATAQSNLLTGFTYANTSGTRIQGLGSSGIQFQNATTPVNTGYTANKLGEAVLAVSTTGRTQVQLNWKAQTKTTAGNVMGMRCQYRIGSSGTYLDFSPVSDFVSSTNLNDSTTFTINFPQALENQTLIQIRWIYYKVSGTSSSSRTIRLDDISVTSLPAVTLSQHPDVCLTAAPFTITDGAPSGGVYSGTGVVNGTDFDPAVSGAGTFPLTYTYTDANLISNSVTVNINVSSGACVTPIGLAFNSCGATGLMKNSYIYCETAPGAQDYEYEFSGGDLSAPVLKRRTNWFTDFNLGWVSQLNYGQTYNVRVRAKIASVWGVFANTCTISLAAVTPTPQLVSNSCGATGLSLTSYIYTTTVSGAQDYEYRFENTSLNYVGTRTRGNSMTNLNLSWVSGLQYGYTYDVTVRAKINGVWGSFGNSCQITLQAFPLTQLNTASCGAIDLLRTNTIYCDPVPAATNYQYRFTPVPSGTPFTRLRNSSATDLPLSYVTQILPSMTYNVEVRSYAGGAWSNYGTVCQITTSPSYNAVRLAGEEGSEPLSVSVYPNPASGSSVQLNLNGNSESVRVEIADISGRIVSAENVQLNNGSALYEMSIAELESGLYFIHISSGNQRVTERLVVKK